MTVYSATRCSAPAAALKSRTVKRNRCSNVVARAAAVSQGTSTVSANYMNAEEKHALVRRLIAAKDDSGLTLDDIGEQLGVTNVFAGQILHNQTRLTPDLEEKLRKAVPGISEDDIAAMRKCPSRSYDPNILQDPHIFRMNEAVLHFGQSIKASVNEKFGDGIMSAIDFYVDVDKVKGPAGEARVVITFNGKYLPYAVQYTDKAAVKEPMDE